MKALRLAVGFLTIIPLNISEYQPGDLGRSGGWFTWVGFVIGGITALGYWTFYQLFTPFLAATLAVGIWIGLTGGLHLDGLVDSFDGLLSSAPQKKRLEIMRDPHLGTFGGIGLIFAILLKIAAVAALSQPLWTQPANGITWGVFAGSQGAGIILAAVCGRWTMLLAARHPSARTDGLGASFAAGLNTKVYILAGTILLTGIVLTGWRGLIACLAGHLIMVLVTRLAHIRLGGVTGDILGLTIEATELSVLLIFAATV